MMRTTSIQAAFASSPNVSKRLVTKLHPARFPGMSCMAAIVGCVLGVAFTTPAIEEIVITSDGFALARCTGQVGTNVFIGTYHDLRRNWIVLLDVAGLTPAERIHAESLFAGRIGIYEEAAA